MNKIEANHVDFYYGDFHALKTYLYLSPKIKLWHLSARRGAGNQHSYGFSIE